MSLPTNIENVVQWIFPQIQTPTGTVQLRINTQPDLGFNPMTGPLSGSVSGTQICWLNTPHDVIDMSTYEQQKSDLDGDLTIPEINFRINDSFLLNGILGNNTDGNATGGTPIQYNFGNFSSSADNTSFLDNIFRDTSSTAVYEVYLSRSSNTVPLDIWFWGNVDVNNIPKEIMMVVDEGTPNSVFQTLWSFKAVSWLNKVNQATNQQLIERVSGWDWNTRTFNPIATNTDADTVFVGMSSWGADDPSYVISDLKNSQSNIPLAIEQFSLNTNALTPGALNPETWLQAAEDIVLGYQWNNQYFPATEFGHETFHYPNIVAKMSVLNLAKQSIATAYPLINTNNVTIDSNMMFDFVAQQYEETSSSTGFALHTLATDWSKLYVMQNFLFGFSIVNDSSLTSATGGVNYLTNYPNSLSTSDPITNTVKWISAQTGTFISPGLSTSGDVAIPTMSFIGRRTKASEIPTNWILCDSAEQPNTFDSTAIIVQNLADNLQVQAGTSSSNVKTIQIPWRSHKLGPITMQQQHNAALNRDVLTVGTDGPDYLWYWFDHNLPVEFQPLAVMPYKADDYTTNQGAAYNSTSIPLNSVSGFRYGTFKTTDKGWVGSTNLLWRAMDAGSLTANADDIFGTGASCPTFPFASSRFIDTNYYAVTAILPAGTTLPTDEHLTPTNSTLGYFCPLVAYAQFYYQEFAGAKVTLTQTYQGCVDDNGRMSTIRPGIHMQTFIHNKLRDFNAHQVTIDPINETTTVVWVEQFYKNDGTPNGNGYTNPPVSVVNAAGSSSSSGGGPSSGAPPSGGVADGPFIKEYPVKTSDNYLQPLSGSVTGITFALSSTADTSDFIVFKRDSLTAATSLTRFEYDGTISTQGKFIAGKQQQPNTTVDVYGDFSLDNQIAISLSAGQNNDVAIGAHSNIYILANADAQISGFDTPQAGKILDVYLDLAPTRIVTFQHENAGSLVPNRLHLETLSNISVTGQAYATFIYDTNETRWIPQSIISGASLTAHDKLAGSPYFIDDTGTPTRSSVVVGGTSTSKDAIAIGAGATASKTSAIAIGWNSTASGNYSFAVNNVDQPNGAFASNSISIGKDNLVDSGSLGGVVVGGVGNKVLGSVSAGVYAGSANIVTAASDGSVIVGGTINTINDSRYSVIDGGLSGVIYASDNSVIGAGELNSLSSSTFSAILGGLSNTVVNTAKSAILGGELNSLLGSLRSEILGGYNNAINGAGHFEDNIIAGGENQTITSTSGAFIGTSNTSIITNSNEAAILGGSHNSVTGSPFASVFGSTGSVIYSAPKSIVLGGDNVTILNAYESAAFNSTSASINSSTGSVIIATGSAGNGVGSISGAVNSFIIGGYGHSITNDGALRSIGSAIIGGVGHSISGSNDAIMLGGFGNRMVDSDQGTIIGSEHCFIDATTRGHITNSLSSTVNSNTYYSNILGGQQNILGGAATIHGSNMLGGQSNTAWSEFSTVAGLGNLVNGYAETRLGYFGKQELSQSPTATAALDLLFAIGNGTGPGSLSDAFRVDNGGRVSATSYTGSVSYFTSKNIDANGIGTTTNNIGSTYADNTVIAWCELSYSNGGSTVLTPAPVTMNSSFNISNPPTVAGVGSITLTLLSGLPTDVVIQATAKNIATPAPFIVNATYGGGVITIDTFNAAGALANAAGVFITIFGRK